jgi:hypothetical protein
MKKGDIFQHLSANSDPYAKKTTVVHTNLKVFKRSQSLTHLFAWNSNFYQLDAQLINILRFKAPLRPLAPISTSWIRNRIPNKDLVPGGNLNVWTGILNHPPIPSNLKMSLAVLVYFTHKH